MFCSKCGTQSPEGASFCYKCGAKLGTHEGLSERVAEAELGSSTERREIAKAEGFIRSLFDLSFRDMVTPKVIKVLYVILLVVAGIVAILVIASMFMMHPGLGVLALLILGPLYFFLSALGYRVMLELVMVIFGIKQELAEMHSELRKGE